MTKPQNDQPVSYREVVAAILWTVLADLLIFRTMGYAGPAFFVALVPLFFVAVSSRFFQQHAAKFLTILLVVVVVRMVWQGSPLTLFSAVAVTVGIAMSAAGEVPLVMEVASMAARCTFDGAARLSQYRLPRKIHQSAKVHSNLLSLLIPLVAFLVFGSIFVFANPIVFTWMSKELSFVSTMVMDWLSQISVFELPFCIAALLIGIGLMRPSRPLPQIGPAGMVMEIPPGQEDSTWYPAFRNTLMTLIALFAVYLAFEFATLWKREFPVGFYYAGYAHQGAAWLTFALALATAFLSLIFRQSMLRDPRLIRVRNLAWLWSGLNLLLAIAVYNRLLIYVGYNGMTQMRTVGFFGITLVVIGFCLVLYKIANNRSFWWLIRMQLVALTLAAIAYSVFPVDWVAHRYNASRVQDGYLHPIVMIAVKPISHEGISPLLTLVDHNDKTIREGVLALLAQRQQEIDSQPVSHWTQFQLSRHRLSTLLKKNQQKWQHYQNATNRNGAIDELKAYSMKWY